MKMNILYTAFFTAAVCAGTGVFAQEAAENPEKFCSMERIASKSGWFAGDNPTALSFNQANYSIADINFDYEKGSLRNVDMGSKQQTMGIQSESYRSWDRISFYGKIGFNYSSALDRSWSGNVNMYDSPMNVGDSIAGNHRDETYFLKAGVSYRIGNWVIGAMGEYQNQSLAKRRDPRNKNAYMHLSIRPGVMFTSKPVNVGLNLSYQRTTEEIEYDTFGTNENLFTLYEFEGLWFYKTEQFGSTGLDPILYKGAKYGGSAQVEFNLSKSVKFFNQFSMEYSEMERFRRDKGEKMGDNDAMTYRYMGVLSVTGKRVDHVLSANASFGDLFKYNNIQELIIDPISSQKMYKQYGRIQKFAQRQHRVDAAYKLYVKRNEWNSSWIVGLDYSYVNNESEYKIAPAVYSQNLHYSRLSAGATKNFLFNGHNWLDISIKGGYTFGGGTMFEEYIPEGVTIENPNYRADLLAQEYNFLTNDRAQGEAGLRYTHFFPKKRMGLYVDVKGRCEWGRSGMFDGMRRGGMMAAVGVNF